MILQSILILPIHPRFLCLLVPPCPISFPRIYLDRTHFLPLIDLMSLLHSLLVSPTSSHYLFLPRLGVRWPAFTMWGFIRSAWTALTLVMRYHYWTKVRDPSMHLSSLPCLIRALPPYQSSWSVCCNSTCLRCNNLVCNSLTKNGNFNQMPQHCTGFSLFAAHGTYSNPCISSTFIKIYKLHFFSLSFVQELALYPEAF